MELKRWPVVRRRHGGGGFGGQMFHALQLKECDSNFLFHFVQRYVTITNNRSDLIKFEPNQTKPKDVLMMSRKLRCLMGQCYVCVYIE